MEEQTATTNEMGRNVGEAAKGSAEIAQNITAVAQAARSTTEGASHTQSAASELARMALGLQELVGQFSCLPEEAPVAHKAPRRAGSEANGHHHGNGRVYTNGTKRLVKK